MDTLRADIESIDFTSVNSKPLTWEETADLIEFKIKPLGDSFDYIITSIGDNLFSVYLRRRLTEEEWKLKTNN